MSRSLLSSPLAIPQAHPTPGSVEDRLRQRTARIVVVGLGNAGLPMAVELARAGFQVVGYDVATAQVDLLNSGRSPVRHVADEAVAHVRQSGALRATTNPAVLADSDVAIVCVPTPLAPGGAPDLRYVRQAGRAIADHLHPGMLVVLQSTCPPGTTTRLLQPLLEAASGLTEGTDFHLVHAPERIDPGNPRFGAHNTPKLVGGASVESTRLGCRLFETCVDQVIPVSSPEVAELAKLVENTFRFVNIGFANELALLCERVQVDVSEVIQAAATKPFAFMAHQPSPGVGGDCIPVVPFFLESAAREVGMDLQLVQAAARIDRSMPRFTVDQLQAALAARGRSLEGAQVLAIGVTYKPDAAGTSNSAAVRVLAEARARGARITYHDPLAPTIALDGEILESVPLVGPEIARADAVLLLTAHRGLDFDLIAREARLVVDTRPDRTAPDQPNAVNIWRPRVAPAIASVPPTPRNGTTRSLSRPKFLLYSHDTYGLGNIRRTLLLAEELATHYPHAAILIVTGSPMIHAFRIPEGVDYIKLPCLDRVDADRYEPRFLSAWAAEVRRIRSALLEQAVFGFAPDLMIVDKRPGGVDGELLPALRRLRQAPHATRLVLGMRDILDAPERTRRSFANSRTFDTILEHYDEVWIYGEQSIFDVVEQYAFPEAVARMTHFCGYLKRSSAVSPRTDRTPHVLVTTGGGGDGSRMIETYLQGVSALPPVCELRTTVVLGPEMPVANRAALLERFGQLAQRGVTFVEFEPDLPLLLSQSDVVVSMAGYNTICELLLFGRRAVLVPRAEPVQEQLIRARLLAERGYFDMVEPDELTPELLMSRVFAALQSSPPGRSANAIDLDGLPRIRQRVHALLGARIEH
jgi:UDP-N-acetyl-D-glucosamine dehydrogenase